MSTAHIPNSDYVCQALRYKSGELYWRVRPRDQFKTTTAWKTWNTKHAGTLAGYRHVRDGGDRWLIHVGGKLRRRSKLVWLMHHGVWPDMVDHANRNTLDDRIKNLRVANQTQNNGNTRKHIDGMNVYKGAYKVKGYEKWVSSIKAYGKVEYLGQFNSPEEAHAAYCAAAERIFGEFANNGET